MTKAVDATIRINKREALELLEYVSEKDILQEIAVNDPLLWIHTHVGTEFGTQLSFNRRPYLVDIIRDFSPHIAVSYTHLTLPTIPLV